MVIAPFLQYIFTLSIENRSSPKWLGHCKRHPSFQKKKSREPSNYRPISLTSVSCNIMEHVIYRHIMNHLDSNSILVHYQHGFRQQHSYEMQLITVIESVAGNLDLGQYSDLLLLDFSKAFDTVPHRRLLNKLDFYGIRGNLKTWLEQWLTTWNQIFPWDQVCRGVLCWAHSCSFCIYTISVKTQKHKLAFSRTTRRFKIVMMQSHYSKT